MKYKKEIITENPEQTQKAGEKFVKDLLASQGLALQGETFQKKAFVLALYGELGSGKTTFVQGLAKGLGITKRILSPTYTLVREHEIKLKVNPSTLLRTRSEKFKIKVKSLKLYHIDLYRVENEKDIRGLGIEEILNDSKNVVVIEWAEKMGKLLPKERIDIHFRYLDESRRKIIISNKPINK